MHTMLMYESPYLHVRSLPCQCATWPYLVATKPGARAFKFPAALGPGPVFYTRTCGSIFGEDGERKAPGRKSAQWFAGADARAHGHTQADRDVRAS